MRFAYSVLGVVALVQVLALGLVGSWSPGLLVGTVVMVAMGALVAFAARAIARAIARRRGRSDAPPGIATAGESLISPRVLAVVLATGVAFVLAPKPLGAAFPLLGILTEIILLLLAGALLGGWSRAAGSVPVVVAVLIRIADAADAVISLLSTPGVRFQLGPELSLFAVQRYAAVLVWVPLDIALVFGAWKVAAAGRGAPGGGQEASAPERHPDQPLNQQDLDLP